MFRFACLVVLRGGRGATDKCHWRVWGALTVFWPHWVCPAHGCVFSPSTLLRLQAALYGAGPAWRAVPVFGSSTKAQPQWGLRFVPSPPSSSGRQELDGRSLPGCRRLLPSAAPASVSAGASRVRAPRVCSGELASSRDPPGRCQPSRTSGSLWLETGSLFAVW